MGCDSYVNGEADTKPFSIRQFVVDTRRKDIFHCWPFPQKYLQICLKYGISNVLPPFEPCNPVIVQEKLIKDECNSYYDEVLSKSPCHGYLKSHLDNSCNKHKDERNLSSDPVNQQSSSVQGSHLYVHQRINTVSPKRMRHKQRKHKRRQKKRSMLDILARAKPCTLEDLYRIRCNSINLSNDVDESSRLMAHVEDLKDDDEACNDNLSSKNSRLLKIMFGGCISKSWNIS